MKQKDKYKILQLRQVASIMIFLLPFYTVVAQQADGIIIKFDKNITQQTIKNFGASPIFLE